MTAVMQGVRILEVAEHTFVPAASALLSDWGAEVIKIEHVERGDAMRGLASSGLAIMGTNVHVLLEHSNRGKKSLALDLTSDEGLEILYELAKTCDVFLTNKLPSVRTKLRIAVEDIRAANPDIIYVRGTGQGENGPDADKGAYDHLAFWCRAGISVGATKADYEYPVASPAPAFGDSIGAMTIAGGIMGALFHRANTGEATVVDVSLLGVGIWAMGAAFALSLQFGTPWMPPPGSGSTGNPLVQTYRTADDRWLSLSCLQAAKYWPEAVQYFGRPELATDPRFVDHASITANAAEATAIVAEIIRAKPLAEWREILDSFTGQWAVVQNTLEAATDPQTVANGYIRECTTAEGHEYQLACAPVQFGGEAAQPGRAPEFNQHGDEILQSIGLDWDRIVELKLKGVVA